MEFSKKLREARKAKGLKQIELADLAGISINSVRLYEAGKRTPTLAVAGKIAAALGVPVVQLIGGSDPFREGYYQRVYICSPYREDTETNAKICRTYCRMIFDHFKRTIPIAPHIYLTQFLDDDDPEQRAAGLAMGRAILATCHVVLVFGDHVSEGMRAELEEAAWLGIPVYSGREVLRGLIPTPVLQETQEPRKLSADDLRMICGGLRRNYPLNI